MLRMVALRFVRRFIVLILIVAFMAATMVALASASTPKYVNLNGYVVDANNNPLPGVRVYMYTAHFRVGESPMCPFCWLDCQKSATSSKHGNIVVRNLDPRLVFTVLAVRSDFVPVFVRQVDPAKGAIKIMLNERRKAADPDYDVTGSVVDTNGKPVLGAEVWSIAAGKGGTMICGSSGPNAQAVAITDEHGQFILHGKLSHMNMIVQVVAKNYATQYFPHNGKPMEALKTGTKYTLTLTHGANLTGKLRYNGRPIANKQIRLVTEDDDATHDIGRPTATTDNNGGFIFYNLTPGRVYELFTTVNPANEFVVAPHKINAMNDGQTVDLGKIEASPVVTHHARVEFEDGSPITSGMQMNIQRMNAFDIQIVPVASNGAFTFMTGPGESVWIQSASSKYGISKKTPGVDYWGLNTKIDLTNEPKDFVVTMVKRK